MYPGRDPERISGEEPWGGEENEHLRIRPGETYLDGEAGCLEDGVLEGIKEGELRGRNAQLVELIKKSWTGERAFPR